MPSLVGVKIGCMLPLSMDSYDQVLQITRQCERIGFDSVWAFDHLSPYWTRSAHSLECWTVLAALAEQTTRIRVGSLVTNINLRHPALLARMTAVVDQISKGRLSLCLGTGDHLSKSELTSYGYEYGSLKDRVERLSETVQILKALWTKDNVTFNGHHYQITQKAGRLEPAQHPHPPIWIGGRHREILSVIAESADGWNYWDLNRPELEEKTNYLRDCCIRIGRPFDEITKSWAGVLSQEESVNKETALDSLRKKVRNDTRYLIASFGPQARRENYEVFAEAAAQL